MNKCRTQTKFRRFKRQGVILTLCQGIFLTFCLSLVASKDLSAGYPVPTRLVDHQVVLLTSVDFEAHAPMRLLRNLFAQVPERLAHQFRSHFVPLGFRLRIRHHATQSDLWEELRNPENVGVFWLSHAGAAVAPSQPGLASQGLIVDEEMNDLAPILQGAHSDLKFLAVVGCKSRNTVQTLLRTFGVFERNPELVVADFDTRIDVFQGLARALEQSRLPLDPHALESFRPHRCQATEMGFPVRITRTLPSDLPPNATALYPAVRIENRDRVIGVFPRAFRGMRQSETFWIPAPFLASEVTQIKFKILSNTGAVVPTPQTSEALGRLSLLPLWEGVERVSPSGASPRWEIFSGPDGQPIGGSMHVYRYRGQPPTLQQALPFQPFSCRDRSQSYF